MALRTRLVNLVGDAVRAVCEEEVCEQSYGVLLERQNKAIIIIIIIIFIVSQSATTASTIANTAASLMISHDFKTKVQSGKIKVSQPYIVFCLPSRHAFCEACGLHGAMEGKCESGSMGLRMMRTWVVTSPRVVGIECYREIKFTAGSLALLYGYVHRSVKKICRDAPDRAARAPHAVSPPPPGHRL